MRGYQGKQVAHVSEHVDLEQPVLQKADFGEIYSQPDPRDYFNTLSSFDYTIPQEGARVFNRLLEVYGPRVDYQPTILDVCCSYGIVSTLIKTDLTIEEVGRHYCAAETASLTSEQLRETDSALLEVHARPSSPRVIGLDISPQAVEYAVVIGSLDAGFVENLEEHDPSPELVEALGSVDLITSTGGVGYVTDKTFTRLVRATRPSTHVAVFCLRTYDYAPIAAALAERGLVTEQATQTFRQRRFVDADEQAWAVSRVRELGFDPEGVESDGYYHANFFLSRPQTQVDELPLAQLLA